jgi:geranylgeranyl diphosphate synthase, type II
MELRIYLDEKRAIVEGALNRFFPRPEGPASDVVEAMRYSLFAGGKRLRPILCMAGASAVGGDESNALPVACALELIHTYSLIHDDLPAMDDDDMRRGKPTCHKVFVDAVAVLAGDGLLTEAFHLMGRGDFSGPVSPSVLLKAVTMIASSAGYQGMVGGQVVDIQSEGKGVDASLVEYIHTHKTGALITASVASGALIGGGTAGQVVSIQAYGQKIGLAFQIADDILDIEGDTRTLGKGVGNDARKKKITFPSVLGLEKSKEIQQSLIKEAVDLLESFDHRADPLREIALYIIERKK